MNSCPLIADHGACSVIIAKPAACLAGLLTAYRGLGNVVVLGLARGGVPVAWEVAAALGASLDVSGKTVIFVDGGLATGSSVVAAVQALPVRAGSGVVPATPWWRRWSSHTAGADHWTSASDSASPPVRPCS